MQAEPAESLVVQDLPTNRTNRHTNRHTNRALRLGNSYKPYIPLRIGVLESKPPWCTVCAVCTNSFGAVHGLYDGLYDGTVCRMAAAYLHCRRGGRSCGVCNSLPPRFFGSLLRAACVPPIEGSSRLGGATAKAVEGPTSKPSPSEFVVPVVVPGA